MFIFERPIQIPCSELIHLVAVIKCVGLPSLFLDKKRLALASILGPFGVHLLKFTLDTHPGSLIHYLGLLEFPLRISFCSRVYMYVLGMRLTVTPKAKLITHGKKTNFSWRYSTAGFTRGPRKPNKAAEILLQGHLSLWHETVGLPNDTWIESTGLWSIRFSWKPMSHVLLAK